MDLDRFLTFLALEALIRHHDGYSMGINNYRVYVDPAKARAVFMPHGMDQLFFEPRAGLLPDLRGLVAQAVLETQVGRGEFRTRCGTLFTNLFPSLTNRVEMARTKIRPLLAELDPQTARQADEAATNLLRRIQERHSQLERSFSLKPEVPPFNESGVAQLTNWLATTEGRGALLVETNSAGQPVLQVRVSASGGETIARWEKPVLLIAGIYRFSANVLADQPVFRGPQPPVALRIWGVDDAQTESSRADPQTMEFQSTFEVGLGNAGEYLLQCEARAGEFSVTYRLGKIELARLP